MGHERQKSSVPLPSQGLQINGVHDRLGLISGEEVDQLLLPAFARDGEDALDLVKELRLLEGDVAKEGVDRRQAGVACARTIATHVFEMLEKLRDDRRVEIFQLDLCRSFAQLGC